MKNQELLKAKEIEALESYFKTENEHWNEFAFGMLCEVLKDGSFENPEIPLQLFDQAIDIFVKLHQNPLKAVQTFSKEIDKKNLTLAQKTFVYKHVLNYITHSEFKEIDTSEILELLKAQSKRVKKETENQQPEHNKPLTGNIRDFLKQLVQQELEQLPESLKDLEPAQRVNLLCKLIPFVLPKVQSVHSEKGEPQHEKNRVIW